VKEGRREKGGGRREEGGGRRDSNTFKIHLLRGVMANIFTNCAHRMFEELFGLAPWAVLLSKMTMLPALTW
jgi:hypothetical protein